MAGSKTVFGFETCLNRNHLLYQATLDQLYEPHHLDESTYAHAHQSSYSPNAQAALPIIH